MDSKKNHFNTIINLLKETEQSFFIKKAPNGSFVIIIGDKYDEKILPAIFFNSQKEIVKFKTWNNKKG